jgi:hypothetical protein
MKLLYIGENLIDLYPNTVIAQTLQVFDPGRLGSVVTNFTSSIRIPKTANNELRLSFLSNSKVRSTVPYTLLTCKYIENGIPIIQNANFLINDVDEKEYSLNIYSGPSGFFARIQNLKLWDLDFLDINSGWTAADRDGYRNALTGIVQALVDDGRLASSTPPLIENQGTTLKCPQIYYHTIIEKIFSSFGYDYTGDIFDNDIYKKLVQPLGVVYKDPNFFITKLFSAAAPGDQEMIDPAVETTVLFNQNVSQGSEAFYNALTSEYVVVNPDTPDEYFRLIYRTNLTIVVTGGTVDIKIEATGFVPASELNVGSGTYSFQFFPSTGMADGDVVKVTIVKNTGTPTVEIIAGSFYAVPYTGISDDDDETFAATIVEGYVYFNKLFEEKTLLDYLKEFCIRFNVQITQRSNELEVNTMNLILDTFTGPDWTSKREATSNQIKYAFAGYAQRNLLKSPSDNDFSPDLNDSYGDGYFDIPNGNLKNNVTLYTSIFEVTQMINTYGVFMLYLNVGPDVAEFRRHPGNRLFFVREKYDFEPDVLYDAVDRDDYLVGFYFDPDQEYNMSWQFFIDNFHQKFVDRCLRRVRLITRFYNLSDLDIFSFNQQVPIWDDGERFLVTKIMNYVTRKLTKVELLKIEPNPAHTFTAGGAHEITGELEDTMEEIGDDVTPILDIEMELQETVTGNPTWETTFDNGSDSEVLSCVGDNTTQSNTLTHVGSINVDADVVKTDNDGNGPDGFPVDDGWVEWLRNGVQVHTETFDTASHSSLQGLSYTYLNVKAWETLKTIVHEDGTTP